ncbi:hypothetical protein [Microvirga makkahensis]|uniref:Uncharacterized protein n=1 Tax=Microvirga makkahensis TaxID=1128670 RepID=A0A7X3SR78_9HYPH|nr:hypothetical protein [Microvirga makkahensis]MXQ14282.1 hypothetical protein [Microvirga makkahensis]
MNGNDIGTVAIEAQHSLFDSDDLLSSPEGPDFEVCAGAGDDTVAAFIFGTRYG